jgi:hypothetical protein
MTTGTAGMLMRLRHNYSIVLESATKENNPESSSVKPGEEKEQALRIIMRHYAGPEAAFEAARVAGVLIIKIRIDSLAGKRSG